jgi:hypothetical protein
MNRNLRRRASLASVLVPMTAVISGCLPKQPTSTTAPDTSVTLVVPTLVAQPTTPESQSKGGLTIAVAPATYSVSMTKTETVKPVHRRLGEASQDMATGERMVSVVKTTAETPTVSPNQLKFTITINNQMSRVFHGNGTVVQFNVGGHLLAVDQAGYAPLQAAIVPPGSQQQIDIFGPPLDKLPQGQQTLGLFFYDVVTGQDAAGNVTEKQNYTWDFTLNAVPQSVTVPGGTSSREVIPLSEYKAIAAKQGTAPAEADPSAMP